MRCAKAHRLIGEELDGTIGAEDRAGLKTHLEDCADCRELMQDFKGIIEGVREMPKHEPSARVWTAIAGDMSRLHPGAERPEARVGRLAAFGFAGRTKFAWAAAVLLIVAGGIVIGVRPWRTASGLSGEDRITLAKLQEAEKHYQLAIEALTEAIGSQATGLDLRLFASFARNLQDIDAVIKDCRAAVTKNPNDFEARLFLLDAYKDKVAFLDNIIEVRKTQSSAKKTEAKI